MIRFNKKILSLLLAALLAMAPLVGASAATAESSGEVCIIYVSPNGKASGDGSISNPYATLEAARDRIRELKATDQYPGGYTVYLRGGEYNLTKKFSLGSEDSGTEEAPVLYTNYPGEKVTLVGGQAIPSGDFVNASDDEFLDRLADQSVRDKIYKVDLKKYGITDVGEPYLQGAYSYLDVYNFLTDPGVPGSELFFNDNALTIARYPNEGMMSADRVIEKGWDYDTQAAGTKSSDPFVVGVSDNRITKWEASVNAQSDESKNKVLMYGWWKHDWCDQTIPIAAIDKENLNITSAWSAFLCPDVDYGTREFYVYNLIEELDIPGEYYLDYDTCILYVYPPEDLDEAEIGISLMDEELISLSGASNITFSGINVTTSRKYGYYVDGCDSIEISDCEISNTANKAIYLVRSTGCGVKNSHIYNVNGGVVLSGGDEVTLVGGNNYVTNCHIEKFSRISKTYNGAVDVAGVGNIVTHNKIHDGPHLAISYGGQKNDIMYNEIYDVAKEFSDSGAIYGGLTWVGRGCRVMYNYIHDIETASDGNLGISGVYMDGGQCDMTVSSNVFYNIDGGCIWLGGGQDVIMDNNYFIDCTHGLWLQNPMPGVNLNNVHYPRYNSMDDKVDFANNDYWKAEFPKLYTFMAQSDDEKRLPKNNSFKNNLAVNSKLYLGGEHCVAEEYIEDINIINLVSNTDPGFVNYSGKDFTLETGSSAVSSLNGFEIIPFGDIGLIDTPESGSLTDLYFADNIVMDFDPSTTTYSVVVPWSKANGYVLPELKWEPATADVAVTGGLDAGALSVTDGTNTYTINLNKVGENMYENGGAENGEWTEVWCVFDLVTNNPGAGNNSILLKGNGYYTPDATPKTLTPNVTYLASSMVRKSENYESELTAYEEVKSPSGFDGTTINFDGSFYKWNADGSARSGNSAVDATNWLTHYRTIVANSAVQVVDQYHNGERTKDLVVDEYFLGELVVADVKVTDAAGLRSADMVIPDEEKTINLSAVKLNQLGNQAGLGTAAPTFTWDVKGPSDDVTVNNGVVTIGTDAAPGTYYVSATVPTEIAGSAQTHAKGTYKITVGKAAVKYTQTDEDVICTLDFVGNPGKYKLVNAIYNVLPNGELEFVDADFVDVLESGSYDSSAIKLYDGQIIKTFLWKWDGLIPVRKCTSYVKQ